MACQDPLERPLMHCPKQVLVCLVLDCWHLASVLSWLRRYQTDRRQAQQVAQVLYCSCWLQGSQDRVTTKGDGVKHNSGLGPNKVWGQEQREGCLCQVKKNDKGIQGRSKGANWRISTHDGSRAGPWELLKVFVPLSVLLLIPLFFVVLYSAFSFFFLFAASRPASSHHLLLHHQPRNPLSPKRISIRIIFMVIPASLVRLLPCCGLSIRFLPLNRAIKILTQWNACL